MAKNQFVHLHCHTGGSVLDGHATVKEMVAEAAYLGQPAIAVTDHGGMHFAHELYQEAKEQGIKGIVGIEAYMTPGDASMKDKAPIFFGAKTKEERLEGAQDVSAGGAYTHMTLLAENNEGMHNLFKLTSLAWKEGYYKKPRMDIESLSNNSKGIIATTGCPSGELQTRLRLGQWDEAVKYVDKMQSIFGKENYFLELMDHDMKVDIERIVKDDLLKIGKYMDIPLLATNDLHYTRREQAKSHEQLLAVQSGSKMTDATYDNGGKRFAFSGEEFYVKSADEMEQVFGHLPTALTNTLLIAERCNVSFDYNDTLRPNVPLPTGMTETEFIKREAFEGLQRRLPEKANDKHYTQRLDMELSVLDLKGYNGYFLVTSDFVRWARNNGVEVGYGRGCLSGDSNVLTPNGFVKIKDIKVGDIVFNEYGEQIPVPEVFEYDCDEELVEIKAYYGGNGNKMTADHKVLVSKAGTKLSPEWMRADQVEINDYVVMPKISTVPEMHNLPDSGESTDVDGTCNYFSDENFHYYRVSEINAVPAEGKVYDFTVPGAHSYVTDSYVVHNSAGGSLVSYCLDITDLDPIRFDLLFERFINPERDSPPDIDMDFDDVGRDRVIQYVSATYGSDKVAQIVTFGKIGAKQAIKDSIRVLDEPYNLGDVLTKAIPPAQAGKEMKLKDLFDRKNARYEEGDNFREEVAKLANKDIITSALGLEGRMRSTGVHAAGVIISSKKLDESIPLFSRPKDGITLTQFDYPTCESLGLLKFDFLGIRNLTIVAKAIAHIKRRHGITLNAVEIVNGPMDDAPTYELLRNGDTLGIFQLDSGGMRSLLKLIEPTEIGDILAVLALYRPGPMGMNSHIEYADRKNGRKPVVAPHPELEEIFNTVMGDTFGLCVAGDTLVPNAKTGELVRIDSIEDQVKSGNFSTFSIASNGSIVSNKVSNWFATGKKKIYEIKSGDGRIIRVSGEHPILTPTGYKEAKDIVPGIDRIATAGESFEHSDLSGGVSEAEASLMGYLIGDGYINLYQNTFTNSSPELLEKVASLAKDIFDDMHIRTYPRVRNGKHYTNHMFFSATPQGVGKGFGKKGHRYDDFKMNHWLKDVMDYKVPTASPEKFVPDAIYRSSNNVIKSFLAGLWDTDGHVSSSFSYLRTISKDLASGTQLLLDRLGIHSYLYEGETYQSQRGERKSYGVYVYDEAFWGQIVPLLVHPGKNRIVKTKVSSQAIDKGISSTLMKQTLHRAIVSTVGFKVKTVSEFSEPLDLTHRAMHKFMKNRGYEGILSNGTQFVNGDNGFAVMNGNSLAYLREHGSDEDFFYAKQSWSLVKEVTISGEEEVYDITVENDHNFFANGVISHNCTYQEQLMKAAQVAAGYTLAQADNLRRAMGKKKMEVLQKEYVPFSAGMKENGYSDGAIKSLWDIFVPFAEYGFNKSHSAGYALLSYVTAYLKANYPAEYMAALLSCTMGDKDKTAIYLEECRRMGIEVSSPNVSSSLTEYTPVSDDNILVGMEAVRGVGYEVAKGIMDEATLKEFTDLTDFLSRVPSSALSKGVIEGLIDAGGFDSFGYTRRSLAQRLPDLAKGFSKVKKTEEKGQFDLFGALEELDDVEAPDISIPDLPEYTKKDKLARERHVLGLYVSDHPLSGMADTLDSYVSNHIVDIARGDLIASEGFGDKKDKVSFAGVVGSLIRKPSRKGEMFASFTVEDMTGTIEAVMFPKVYASFGHLLEPDGIYVATGSLLSKGENEVSFAVDSIEIIETTDSGEIPFMIRLGHEQTTAESLDMLEDTLRRHPGDQKVQLHVRENGLVNMTELGKDFNVRVSQNLKNEISYLFGINWM